TRTAPARRHTALPAPYHRRAALLLSREPILPRCGSAHDGPAGSSPLPAPTSPGASRNRIPEDLGPSIFPRSRTCRSGWGPFRPLVLIEEIEVLLVELYQKTRPR